MIMAGNLNLAIYHSTGNERAFFFKANMILLRVLNSASIMGIKKFDNLETQVVANDGAYVRCSRHELVLFRECNDRWPDTVVSQPDGNLHTLLLPSVVLILETVVNVAAYLVTGGQHWQAFPLIGLQPDRTVKFLSFNSLPGGFSDSPGFI